MPTDMKIMGFKVPVVFAERVDHFSKTTGLRKSIMVMAALERFMKASPEDREEMIREVTTASNMSS